MQSHWKERAKLSQICSIIKVSVQRNDRKFEEFLYYDKYYSPFLEKYLQLKDYNSSKTLLELVPLLRSFFSTLDL
jgi:hypothetical protein